MRVLKFGGAALRDGAAVAHAARIVREHGGERPLVVVSAHAGVTRLLEAALDAARGGGLAWDPIRIRHRTLLRQLELPSELLDRPLRELKSVLESVCRAPGGMGHRQGRMRDFVLSFGERMSARVFAETLRRSGVEATPVDAHDLGLVCENGRLVAPEPERARLARLLADVPGIPVVTGFFAMDRDGHLTTLGANGSDLTASWFGAALGAEHVQLWKRVAGLSSADPALVPEARRLPRIGFLEAEALARHGSCVLHPETIEPARRTGVPIQVRNLERPSSPGTRIGLEARVGATAIAHREAVAELSLPLGDDSPATARLARVFDTLAHEGVELHLGWIRTDAAAFLVPDTQRLERCRGLLPAAVRVVTGLSTLTLVAPSASRDELFAFALESGAPLGVRVFQGAGDAVLAGEAAGSGEGVLVLPRANLPRFARDLHAHCLSLPPV